MEHEIDIARTEHVSVCIITLFGYMLGRYYSPQIYRLWKRRHTPEFGKNILSQCNNCRSFRSILFSTQCKFNILAAI